MQILITGARGFVGSHLGNTLVGKGHTVVGIDDLSNPSTNNVSFHVTTMKVGELTPDHIKGMDAIFHLAAKVNVDESIAFPQPYFDANVSQTIHLLELVRMYAPQCKFIYASTSEVYGSGMTKKMDESHPLDAASPYAVSKMAADRLVTIYGEMHGLYPTPCETTRDIPSAPSLPFFATGQVTNPDTPCGDPTACVCCA